MVKVAALLDTRFDRYADGWLKDCARIECKSSTADGYEGVLEQYLRPRFGRNQLHEIRRDDIKALINELISKDLSRNTIRNVLCVIRGLFLKSQKQVRNNPQLPRNKAKWGSRLTSRKLLKNLVAAVGLELIGLLQRK